jgi:Na+-translocating ferredoxin:NAD+ oxidoreductase RnfA subunit
LNKRSDQETALRERTSLLNSLSLRETTAMSGIRERLELSSLSSVVRGAAITLMVAGVLSMTFMGFAGMGR